MLSDLEIISHHFPDRQDIIIYPIADVHLGSAEHMARDWERFCSDLLKQPNAYLILGGDLLDNGTKTSVTNAFEATMRPMEAKRLMCEMLAPLSDRILCMVSGNHEDRAANRDADNDISYDIACKLNAEHLYRKNVAFVKLRFGKTEHGKGSKRDGRHNPTYVFAVTHGSGSGLGAINRNQKFGYVLDGCDCLIVGHSHRPYIEQPAKIKIDPHNNIVSIQPFKIVSMTSWLGWGGYAARQMLPPASHALQTITVCGKKKEIKVEM